MLEKKNYKNSRVKLLKKKKQTLILKDRFRSFKPKQQFSVGNHGFAFKKCLTKGRTSLYNEKKRLKDVCKNWFGKQASKHVLN